MKKIIISLILLSVLVLPVVATAQIPPQPGFGTIGNLDVLYQRIATLFWQIFAIIALIMFIVAGILFLTAGGDPDKVVAARSAFLWGVVGIVVAMVAFSIVLLTRTSFGV